MTDTLRIKKLLARYLADHCQSEELPELFAALETPEGQLILKDFLDQEAQSTSAAGKPLDAATSDRIFERLTASIQTPEPATPRPLFPKKIIWQLAAAFIGILMIAGLGYFRFEASTLVTVATEAGQKRTVILPDGSRAILNGNSTLVYDDAWNGEAARRVTLEGEAYFDISHDADHPFYVKTSRLEVKVLGTAFNVKSDKANAIFETTLIRGQVTVRDLDAPELAETVLRPDEKAVFGKVPVVSAIQPTKVEPDRSAYWTKGRLVFEDTPIGIIASELEKWYGVEITLSEASKECRFYLNVEKETLPEVLALFEAVSGAKSEINGKSITLNGSLCNKNQL